MWYHSWGQVTGTLQLFGQREGEHHLGQLALRVAPSRVVALLEHHVPEVDGPLSTGGHVHDARGRALPQKRKEHVGQEGAGAVLEFAVTLSRAAAGQVK